MSLNTSRAANDILKYCPQLGNKNDIENHATAAELIDELCVILDPKALLMRRPLTCIPEISGKYKLERCL